MEKGSQKTQAYPWICRGFLRTLDPQEIGADRDKNRSVKVKDNQGNPAMRTGLPWLLVCYGLINTVMGSFANERIHSALNISTFFALEPGSPIISRFP